MNVWKEQGITGNPQFLHITTGATDSFVQQYSICLFPTEKKSGLSVCTHQHTSAFTSSAHWKCFTLRCFFCGPKRWKFYVQGLGCIETGQDICMIAAPGIVLWCGLYEYEGKPCHGEGSLLCEHAKSFPLDGFLHVLHCCTVVVSICWSPMVQKLKEKIALCIPEYCQQYHPQSVQLLNIFVWVVVCFHSIYTAFNVRPWDVGTLLHPEGEVQDHDACGKVLMQTIRRKNSRKCSGFQR